MYLLSSFHCSWNEIAHSDEYGPTTPTKLEVLKYVAAFLQAAAGSWVSSRTDTKPNNNTTYGALISPVKPLLKYNKKSWASNKVFSLD